ncbi:MAG: hypothetical protein AAB088_00875 [Actinomycetota bacterium]
MARSSKKFRGSKTFIGMVIALVVIASVTFLLTRPGGSDDNNSSSNELIPESTFSHSHGLAVDVQDASKLYIATHEGLLVLLNDANLYRVGKSNDDYMGFSPHPTDANILYSSGHPSLGGNIGFQKSDDGGFTWNKVSDGIDGPVDFHVMAISPVNPNLIYGWYQGSLQRSTDQGESWEIVNSDLMPIYLVADSQEENVVYVATTEGQGVLVSRDKGVTWAPLSPELEGGAVSVIAVRPGDSKTQLAFSQTLDGLGKSTDSGKTWKKVNEEFNGEVLLQIAFSSLEPNIVYALSRENKLYKSTDAADTWIQIR